MLSYLERGVATPPTIVAQYHFIVKQSGLGVKKKNMTDPRGFLA